MEENGAPSSPDLEVTQAVAPPPSPPEPTAELTRAAQPSPTAPEDPDKRLIQELTRRGVASEEIQRLVALGKAAAPAPSRKSAPTVPTPPEIPPSAPFEPRPTVELPEFRESTTRERIEADRLLTSANVARRRGNFKQAEKDCRAALDLVPRDAAALELYGDICQSVGRVDDAAYAYHRATEADSKRRTAEKKYAELTLLQNREVELLRQEYIPRNPVVATLLSLALPGAGQAYNGDVIKGMVTLLVSALFAYLLWQHHQRRPDGFMMLVAAGLAAPWVYAVADAYMAAVRGKRPKSGWEV